MGKKFFILAGPNGAGKTTISKQILNIYNCPNFINADEIAKGLNPVNQEKVAIESGKIMLKKIEKYSSNNESFCVETTLSCKTYLKKIIEFKKKGYQCYLFFIYLATVEIAIERVKQRVSYRGHNIPTETIKRRYIQGLKNLVNLYWNRVDYLIILNNKKKLELIYIKNKVKKIFDQKIYSNILNYEKE